MANREFEKWLDTFIESVATYDYYTDFEKVYTHVDDIKVELNILNSLIGSKNIETDFINILTKYPETLKCIPVLLAVRANEIKCMDTNGLKDYKFSVKATKSLDSYEDYLYFMRKTGLFDLLENHVISTLIDYVTGVEVGLDSNARKNRTGHIMEDIVESYIKEAGFEKDVTYFKEMYKTEIEDKWGIDLSKISNNGKTEKRFDYVIKTNSQIYGMEVNFYSGGGSKLNETARSYKNITEEAKEIDGFTFVWFTDGKGWKSAKNNLRETFDVLEDMYNINDLKNNIISTKLK